MRRWCEKNQGQGSSIWHQVVGDQQWGGVILWAGWAQLIIKLKRYGLSSESSKSCRFENTEYLSDSVINVCPSKHLLGMSYALWLINADLRKCDLIPVPYHMLEFFLGYVPVCVALFACYGKILAVSLRQRQLIQPVCGNVPGRASANTTSFTTASSARNSKAASVTASAPL